MSRSEKVILTNMCMIEDDSGKILIQNRAGKSWPGVTFPGGHIEYGESFVDAVVREVQEETGLTIRNPQLCGTKQFQTRNDERYIVLMYKTNEFSGEIQSSSEGEVSWINQSDLNSYTLANDFESMYEVMISNRLSEFYYDRNSKVHLK
ncbi:8-oxo-dGTP diphosphatase [Corticicoccus populi]|uniref:8-oxo-dGTP diphosphatase n=1 Tax=Corticicoccus populi TaxID=1812821 RepID=A0ABW5WZM5_9STAP